MKYGNNLQQEDRPSHGHLKNQCWINKCQKEMICVGGSQRLIPLVRSYWKCATPPPNLISDFVFEKYSDKDLRSCLRHLNHRTKCVMFIMMVIMWWWYQIWDWISRLMLRRFVPIKEWCCINTKRKLKMMSKFMARTKFKYCALWEHHPMPYFANMSQM